MERDPTGSPEPPPPFDVDIATAPETGVVKVPRKPVPSEGAHNCSFEPFQVEALFSLGRREGSGKAVLPPAGDDGQRIVIEHVTIDASVPARQGAVAYIEIGEIQHTLVLTPQKGWSNPQRLRASQPIKLYSIGGGDGIGFAGVERSHTTGSGSFHFTVSGYVMVDVT